MPNYTKLHFSGSTGGNVVAIYATSTPGTTIHTATSSTTADSYDEIYLWASSTLARATQFTVWIGNSNSKDDAINVVVPAAYGGPIQVLPGLPVQATRVVQATCADAGYINVFGFVNRIAAQ